MWIIELLVVLIFIFLGARLGSIGIGFAGGLGVLVLALVFGLKPGDIPAGVRVKCIDTLVKNYFVGKNVVQGGFSARDFGGVFS